MRTFRVTWDYLGWKNVPEILQDIIDFTTQENWNNNLLTIIDHLKTVMMYDNDETALNTIGLHPSLCREVIENMFLYRTIGEVKLLKHYLIETHEKYALNEIFVFSNEKPNEHNGKITIENYL